MCVCVFCISSRVSPRTFEIYVPTGRVRSGDGHGLKKNFFFYKGGVRGGSNRVYYMGPCDVTKEHIEHLYTPIYIRLLYTCPGVLGGQCVKGGKGVMGGEGGVSGDDVTRVITSSGPLKCEYFAYIYIKVYGGSRCERVMEREGGWSGG